MATARISLNSPVFSGRLRTLDRRSTYERRPVLSSHSRMIADVRSSAPPVPKPQLRPVAQKIRHTPVASSVPPALPRTERSRVLKRQTVLPPTTISAKRISPGKWRSSLQKKALTALAIVLFVVGIGVAVDGLLTNRHVEAQVEQLNGGGAESGNDAPLVGDVPSEGDRPGIDSYKVAADLPRVIRIPKLAVEARVLRLGVTKDGAVAAPPNIYDTGWYDGSAKPGESGAMLVDGHVHGPTKPGVFVDLKKLKAGDEITVERGDGKVLTYKVVKSKSYPADNVDMGAALTSITPGKPGLNLITCTGEIDKTTNHYKDRLVVFAEQL